MLRAENPAEALCGDVKLWLRISGTALDGEIKQTILAALQDLHMGGVSRPDPGNALIQQAVKLYCKAQFGYEAESEKYTKAYEHLKQALSLCSDYTGEEEHG